MRSKPQPVAWPHLGGINGGIHGFGRDYSHYQTITFWSIFGNGDDRKVKADSRGGQKSKI